MQAVRDPMSSDDAPRAVKLDPADFMVRRKPGEDGFTDDDFWTCRPELEFIRDGAYAYKAAPWATLAYILLMVVDQVPPWIVLPPIVGGYGSYNLYFALVGATGAGKNTAMRAAKMLTDWKPTVKQLSTGPGIAAAYVRYDAELKEMVQFNTRAIFECDEIDKYAGLIKQKFSPDAIIRQMWNGDDTGDQNATAENNRPLEAHTYRFGFCMGVQPSKGEALMSLGAVSGGTTGRFAWLPTTDPAMPHPKDCPPQPEKPLGLELPELPPLAMKNRHHVFPVAVCAEAREAIEEERWLRGTEQKTDDITAHALLVRLKLAVALGVLAGHWGALVDDWHLAGHMLAVSDAARGRVIDRLRADAAERNQAQGRAQAERELVAEDEKHEKKIRRVGDALVKHAADGDGKGGPWVNGSDLRKKIASRDRQYVDEALARAVSAGRLRRRDTEYRGQKGEQFSAA